MRNVQGMLKHEETTANNPEQYPAASKDKAVFEYAAVNKHRQGKKAGSGFNGTAEVGLKIEDLIKRIKD